MGLRSGLCLGQSQSLLKLRITKNGSAHKQQRQHEENTHKCSEVTGTTCTAKPVSGPVLPHQTGFIHESRVTLKQEQV